MAKTNASASPAEQAAPDQPTVARTRSPNYPVYRIDTAIKKAQLLAEEFKRHRVPLEAAAKKIGFTSPKSSSAAQAIAALKAYGFIDVYGSGDKRQVAVSEIGHKIIGNHSDRKSLIEKAALAPPLHAELYKKFMSEDGIAPDATIRQYLVFDRENGRFNEDVVDTFIRQFKGTLSFASLDTSGNISPSEPEDAPPGISVNDFVQWESQGVAQFAVPRRVTRISEDGEWAFVEGSEAGLPIAEVSRAEPPPERQKMNQQSGAAGGSTITPPPNPDYKPLVQSGSKQDTFTADTGEVVVRWPAVLSEDDYADIEGWLEMLKRKIKRSVKGTEN